MATYSLCCLFFDKSMPASVPNSAWTVNPFLLGEWIFEAETRSGGGKWPDSHGGACIYLCHPALFPFYLFIRVFCYYTNIRNVSVKIKLSLEHSLSFYSLSTAWTTMMQWSIGIRVEKFTVINIANAYHSGTAWELSDLWYAYYTVYNNRKSLYLRTRE